jgi:hypothetical protein
MRGKMYVRTSLEIHSMRTFGMFRMKGKKMKHHHSARFLSSAFFLATLLLAGCHDVSSDPDAIVGSGKIVSQPRGVTAYTAIQVTGIGKVTVRQDTASSLRIEADDNIIDRVTTSVNNGILVIGLQQGSYNRITINVFASMKEIAGLEAIGTADFVTTGPIQTNSILCSITGVGSITLSGIAVSQTVQLTGVGDVHNFGLVSTTCTARVSGVGTAEVTATQQLDAVVNGVGSIVYGGNPPVVHQTVTGVGSIRSR